jgi:hypothetical protein
VAAAWPAAPAALQRSASLGVDVDDGCPVDAVLSTVKGRAAQTIAPQIAERAAKYVNGLLDGQQVRTMDMKKGRNEPGVDAAELDRQYNAMEQRLKAYVDQRLEAFDAPSQPRVVPAGAPMQPKLLLIAAVLVALALAAGSWWYLRGRKTNEVAQQADEPAQQQIDVPVAAEPRPVFGGPSTEELRREALKTAIATGSADGKWAQSLKDLIEKNGTIVSAALRDAADGANVEAKAVTPDARDLLLDLATKIDAREALTKADRDNVRQLLVDYAAAHQDAAVSVDGNLRDVKAALLKGLKVRYKVVTKGVDKADADLQSEIILRWLETTAR